MTRLNLSHDVYCTLFVNIQWRLLSMLAHACTVCPLSLSLVQTERQSPERPRHLPNVPTVTSRCPFLIPLYESTDIFRSFSSHVKQVLSQVLAGYVYFAVWLSFYNEMLSVIARARLKMLLLPPESFL